MLSIHEWDFWQSFAFILKKKSPLWHCAKEDHGWVWMCCTGDLENKRPHIWLVCPLVATYTVKLFLRKITGHFTFFLVTNCSTLNKSNSCGIFLRECIYTSFRGQESGSKSLFISQKLCSCVYLTMIPIPRVLNWSWRAQKAFSDCTTKLKVTPATMLNVEELSVVLKHEHGTDICSGLSGNVIFICDCRSEAKYGARRNTCSTGRSCLDSPRRWMWCVMEHKRRFHWLWLFWKMSVE